MSAARREGLKTFFAESPGHLTPDQVARQLIRGLEQDHFLIDSHPGMALALFNLRAEYIAAQGRPSAKRFMEASMKWFGEKGEGLAKL